MERIPIAVLTPELPDLDSKQFRAIVTLIWPFSSSTRQCALLVAEPDFRLRRKRGQVRVCFTNTSARAIAETGIGIGDEVVIGLRGARFVQEACDVSTPGKSIDWELSYSQTLVVQISRDGKEIASLDLVNATQTPAPGSPVRQQPLATPAKRPAPLSVGSQQWSSPAFLKQARLSGDSFFEAGYDPLRVTEDGPDKKRRRKSYKDWTVWKYANDPYEYSKDTFGPSRQSDFTDVRFAFGLDGSMFSQQKEPVETAESEDGWSGDIFQSKGDPLIVQEGSARHESPDQPTTDVAQTEADAADILAQSPPSEGARQSAVDTNHVQEEEIEMYEGLVQDERSEQDESSEQSASETSHDETDLQEQLAQDEGFREQSSLISHPEDGVTNSDEGLEHDRSSRQQTMDIFEQFTTEDASPDDAEPAIAPTHRHESEGIGQSPPLVREPPSEQEVIMLSSDSEAEDSSEEAQSETEDYEVPGVIDDNEDSPLAEEAVDTVPAVEAVEKNIPSPEAGDSHDHIRGRPTRSSLGTLSPRKDQKVEAETEIIDLGSPSGSEISENESADGDYDVLRDPSESVAREAPQIVYSPAVQHSRETSAHTDFHQTPDVTTGSREDMAGWDSTEYGIITDEVDDIAMDPESHPDVDVEGNPDIKVESIEDEAPFQMDASRTRDDDEDSVAGPSAELLIAVPEEGHKMGELQYISVAATGPARNTRSKTKPSLSPMKRDSPPAQQNTRSRRSKTSMTPVAQTSLSPKKLRNRSTVSPVTDRASESNYHLRSRSKMLSPSKPFSSAPEIRSHRKGRGRDQDSAQPSSPLNDSFSQPESFYLEPPEFPDSIFEPSQELGTMPSKFAHVSVVKDSEDGSLHSEHSISTVPFSDDYDDFGAQVYSSFGQPEEPVAGSGDTVEVASHLSPDDRMPASENHQATQGEAQMKSVSQVQVPVESESQRHPSMSSSTPPPFEKKAQRAREGSPMVAPKTSSGSRGPVYELSSDSSEAGDDTYLSDDATPKAIPHSKPVTYPKLPVEFGEGASNEIPSSPPASMGPLAVQLESTSVSLYQQSYTNSNMPVTPDATQQSFDQSQPTMLPDQPEQSLPMTPQPTQTTSAEVVNAKTVEVEVRVEMEETSYKSWIPPTLTTGKPVTRDDVRPAVQSREATPSIHSEDLSASDSESEEDNPTDPPSIGLSTPTSYYTPLKDLSYFTNRSSQFHTSDAPDVLALVTSSTSPAKRADKGPKHYMTSLSVTDLSTFPETTSVQVFRAYSTALPIAQAGDVILLRAFLVKSLNRKPVLVSGEESAWCVWRWGKPVWGVKKGVSAVRARAEIKGPAVEMGEGEEKEVERLRGWWARDVKGAIEEKGKDGGKENMGPLKNGVANGKIGNGVVKVTEIKGDTEF